MCRSDNKVEKMLNNGNNRRYKYHFRADIWEFTLETKPSAAFSAQNQEVRLQRHLEYIGEKNLTDAPSVQCHLPWLMN